jgi:hypothetical protein
MNTAQLCIRYACMTVLLIYGASARAHSTEPWSWTYRKVIQPHELKAAKNNELIFSKLNVPGFSQLIFSWNAIRPSAGYFSFAVQVREGRSKKWGKWHHMVDWGATMQKSHLSSSDGHSKYVHVRLETESGKKADAFRIKIIGLEGAGKDCIKMVAVSTADYEQFKPELLDKLDILPSVLVKGVPKFSQFKLDHPENRRLCSPTSCTMMTSFLRGEHIDPIDFADNVFDYGLEIFGSWPFNMAHAFEQCLGSHCFFTTRLNAFADIHKQLMQGIPVAVSIRGSLDGAPKVYDDGHLLVIVGWDAHKKMVVCHDPAFDNDIAVLKHYPAKSFIRAWECSRRLAYWADPVQTAHN